MSGVRIQNLTKKFGSSSVALNNVSLEVADGEMLVLLGPSGCGKTTLLRCLAGLEKPTSGAIHLGDAAVYDGEKRLDLVPDKRGIGMVFQSYGLWPHMTVLENIRFPLRAQRMKSSLEAGWAEQLAEMVSCSHLLDRHPGELSGGQQQRIALARALVARPSLVLFDEPLSNLDARLRGDLRNAIRELRKSVTFTGVYVTHDQEEGLTVGDRIAVMNAGNIAQLGNPIDVHRDPATDWTSDFMGMTNRVTMKDGSSTRFRATDATLQTPGSLPNDDRSVVLPGASVRDRAFSGNFTEYTLDYEERKISVRLEGRASIDLFAVGDTVDILVGEDYARWFDNDGTSIPRPRVPVKA